MTKHYGFLLSGILATSLLFLFSMMACDKSETAPDQEKPVLNIALPEPNADLVLSGDSLHIQMNISDNGKLKSFNATLKTDGGTTWFSDSPDVNGKNYYTYHRHYSPESLSEKTNMQFIVSASDQAGNDTTTVIYFSVSP